MKALGMRMNYLVLAVLSMFFLGIELSLSRLAIGNIPPVSIALLRCIVASIIIGAYMMYSKTSVIASRPSVYACVAGVFLGIGFILLFNALAKGPVSVIAPMIGLSVLLPAILGIVALHEPFTASKAAGLVLAGLAIILLSR